MNRINAILKIGTDIKMIYAVFSPYGDAGEQFLEELNLWEGIRYGIRHH